MHVAHAVTWAQTNMPLCVTCFNALPHDHPVLELNDTWHRDANHRWRWRTQPYVCFNCQINWNSSGTTQADCRTSAANRSKAEQLNKRIKIFGGPYRGQDGFVINDTFVPITKPELSTINLKEKQVADYNRYVRMTNGHMKNQPYPTQDIGGTLHG